jgi:hypothetical protein
MLAAVTHGTDLNSHHMDIHQQGTCGILSYQQRASSHRNDDKTMKDKSSSHHRSYVDQNGVFVHVSKYVRLQTSKNADYKRGIWIV